MNKKVIFKGIACFIGGAVCVLAILGVGMLMDGGMSYSTNSGVYSSDGYYGSSSMTSGISSGFGAVNKGEVFADMDYAPALSESANSSMPPTSPSGGSSGSTMSSNRKIILWANVRAETKDYDGYVAWLDARVESLGGFYENKEILVRERGYDSREYRDLSATIRIPKESLSDFLNDMDAEGNVVYRNEGRDDVTTAYTDTEAHLESIRIEQQRLNELMAKAETVEDILSIEDRLSYLRYEIESYERQLRSYDSQIDYSRVTLDLEEVLEYAEPEPTGFFERCWDALQDNVTWLCTFVQDSAVFLFGHLPVIIVGSCVGVVTYKVLKKRRELRQFRKPDTQQEPKE